MEWLNAINLGDLSGWGMVAVGVFLLAMGKLVPARTARELREAAAERVRDAQKHAELAANLVHSYKEALDISEAARLDQVRAMDDVLKSIQGVEDIVKRLNRGGEQPHVAVEQEEN